MGDCSRGGGIPGERGERERCAGCGTRDGEEAPGPHRQRSPESDELRPDRHLRFLLPWKAQGSEEMPMNLKNAWPRFFEEIESLQIQKESPRIQGLSGSGGGQHGRRLTFPEHSLCAARCAHHPHKVVGRVPPMTSSRRRGRPDRVGAPCPGAPADGDKAGSLCV